MPALFRLQYASGLRVDYRKCWRISNYLKPVAENLALIGNTGSPDSTITCNFLREITKQYKNVYMVIGPEDTYYERSADVTLIYFQNLRAYYGLYNLHFIYNNVHHIHQASGMNIIGNTLWTSGLCASSASSASSTQTDSSILGLRASSTQTDSSISGLRASSTQTWANEDKKTLIQQMQRTTGPTIVLTCSLWNTNLLATRLYKQKHTMTDEQKEYLRSYINIIDYTPSSNIKAWLCGASPSSVSGMFGKTFSAVNNYDAHDYSKEAFVEFPYPKI